MSTSPASLRASALMLLASLIWGTAFVAQTASIGTVGPFYYTGLRFMLGAALCFISWLSFSFCKTSWYFSNCI